jgi:hypothetical protein
MTRRRFLQHIGTRSVIIASLPGISLTEKVKKADLIKPVRMKTLSFIESMRLTDRPYGWYRFSADVTEPTLYSSTYSAMTRGLYNDLGTLSNAERRDWIAYLQSHQDDDGLYRDPRIFGEGWYKDDPEWCGRRHLTCHVLPALTYLGAVAMKPLRILEPFYEKMNLIAWLEERDWVNKVDFVGNEVLNIGTLLQYARDFKKEARAAVAMQLMLDWLSRNHMNPGTGLWGGYDVKEPKGLSRAVMGAYHFWLLFFYERVPIPNREKALNSILDTQQKDGGFGCGVHGIASSACEDIDSIDPLVRLFSSGISRQDDIFTALLSAEPHVLATQNSDGGFIWIRGTGFTYGHPLMTSGNDVSCMFPTWFRTLSLAYLGKVLPDSIAGGWNWNFCNSPGYQFW